MRIHHVHAERAPERPSENRPCQGCPAGVAPELTARVLAEPEITGATETIVFGDRRVLDKGAAEAGVSLDIEVIGRNDPVPTHPARPVLVDLGNLNPASIPLGEISLGAGAFGIENFRRAIECAAAGGAEVVAWTPFNKAAMRLAHPPYEDEIVYTAELGFRGTASEFLEQDPDDRPGSDHLREPESMPPFPLDRQTGEQAAQAEHPAQNDPGP